MLGPSHAVGMGYALLGLLVSQTVDFARVWRNFARDSDRGGRSEKGPSLKSRLEGDDDDPRVVCSCVCPECPKLPTEVIHHGNVTCVFGEPSTVSVHYSVGIGSGGAVCGALAVLAGRCLCGSSARKNGGRPSHLRALRGGGTLA